jgi:CRISPR-associated endonuclease/helicase Cas3
MTPHQGEMEAEFRERFRALTSHDPFHWQCELYWRFLDGDLPEACDVPTGLGKTCVMQVWLLALAWEALKRPSERTIPLRLVWVVDRRVVVDQATTEAELLANRLADAPECLDMREALRDLSITDAHDGALAVSTLRGERADNQAWSIDPSRPAIIVGTVDMIGSRLLFSGYGDSRRRRPSHAGLLGQDALIVNDEAHLTYAFARLLERLQNSTGGRRPLCTMRLSATGREVAQEKRFPLDFEADLTNEVFRKRYRSVKRLHLVPKDDWKKEIQGLACKADHRTIVFLRFPEDARKLAVAIEKAHPGTEVPRLTGTQRGKERDELLGKPVVQRFLDNAPADGEPCWLVATSAGEVGVNFSADRVITDLDTADHLLQRFGRLNRFGETEGDAYVVYSPKEVADEKGDPHLKETLGYLETLPDVSPETLRRLPPPDSAMSKKPGIAPLLPWHLDVWSMTSLSSGDWPSRPEVDYWLRGSEDEKDRPETYVAWREDVPDLVGVSKRDLEEVFDCYPVLAQERLKQPTFVLSKALGGPSYADRPALLIAADGEVQAGLLDDLLKDWRRLRYGTLVLPPGVGDIDQYGMVDWAKSGDDLARYDVSEIPNRFHQRLLPGEAPPETDLRLRYTVELATEDENEEAARWLYFVGSPPGRFSKSVPLLLTDHQERVAGVALDLARRLGLGERLAHVFEWAGRWHDVGKKRDVWQRAAGNRNGGLALAKSSCLKGGLLGGYRHELGSLLDAEGNLPPDFTDEERDLAMHLIAAHHGWARPHFPQRTFDKHNYRRSECAALEAARRYGRLQQRHGGWGLVYLEAILRCADAIASEETPEMPVDA